MDIPPHMVIHNVAVTSIEQENGELGVYRVGMEFDGVGEVFIVELNRPERSFAIRGMDRWRAFEDYDMRAPSMKVIGLVIKQWHQGQRRHLPVNLADVLSATRR